ncbi:hypothetical protein PF004_g2724 [Phytophthora fragariae]|uniref:Uncharacterized protein n=1 Tax=Phytophthora fragariae TaxID=53985 RepID=A0A6G0PNM2_9STRA|nr:hypothetical protein PF004_g2724 [Phytophthora fragariae]
MLALNLNVQLATSTISSHLLGMAYTVKQTSIEPLTCNNLVNKTKRQKKHQQDGDYIVYIDEFSFDAYCKRGRGRAKKDKRATLVLPPSKRLICKFRRVGDGGSPPQRAIPGRRPHVESLRRKFAKLYKVHVGSGEPTILPEEARSIHNASAITERANVGNGGRIEGDAENPFAEEVSEEDNESPSTNVAVAKQRQREADREQQQRWRDEDRRQREADRTDERDRSNRLFVLLAMDLVGISNATQAHK